MSNVHKILEEQDEQLEDIGQVVKRIKPMSSMMSDEIIKQKV